MCFPSPLPILAFTLHDSVLIGLCLEGFLFGKCAPKLNCTLAKEVQSFPGLGLYSGIFALYLQSPSKESRTATIVFYVLCLLYGLSILTLFCDLLIGILESYTAVSNNSICNLKNIVFYQLCGPDGYYTITSASN